MKNENLENFIETTTSVEVKKMSDYDLRQIESNIYIRKKNSDVIICTITDVLHNEEALYNAEVFSLLKCLIRNEIKKDKYTIKQLKRMYKKTYQSKFRFLAKRNKENNTEETVKIEVETKKVDSSDNLISHTIHIEIKILKQVNSLLQNQHSSKKRKCKSRTIETNMKIIERDKYKNQSIII